MLLPIDEVILSLPHYQPAELERLRQALPQDTSSPAGLDLQAELIKQFQAAKALFERAQTDTETPVNQLTQVINSSAALLKQLAAVQIELHTAERFRCMEQALIELLKQADPEEMEAFLKNYEARLAAIK